MGYPFFFIPYQNIFSNTPVAVYNSICAMFDPGDV